MEGLINEARFPGGLDVMILIFLDAIACDKYCHGVILFLLDYFFGCLLSWV